MFSFCTTRFDDYTIGEAEDRLSLSGKGTFLSLILGILGIGTLTSCYGVPEDIEYYDLGGKVKGKIDGTEQPIKGIEVALRGVSSTYGNEVSHSSATTATASFLSQTLRQERTP